MDVALQARLDARQALIDAEELFERLERARKTAAAIKVPGGAAGSSAGLGNLVNVLGQLSTVTGNAARSQAFLTQAVSLMTQATGVQAQAAIMQLHGAQQTATGSANQFSSALGGMGMRVLSLAASFITLRSAIGLLKDSVEADIQIERIHNTLLAAAGRDAKQAANDFNFLEAEAKRIGFSMLESGNAFAKFSVASRTAGLTSTQTQSIFTSVAEASAVMGLSADQTASVMLALEQMLSKGTVMSQELRLQLGNAMPGALSTFARALGVTNAELLKLVENGNLASRDAVPKFAEQLHKEFSLTDDVNKTVRDINRLKTAWLEFKAELGKTIRPATEAGAKGLTGFLDDQTALMELMKLRLPVQETNRPIYGPNKWFGQYGPKPIIGHTNDTAEISFFALDDAQKKAALSRAFPNAGAFGAQDSGGRGDQWVSAYQRMKAEQQTFAMKEQATADATKPEPSELTLERLEKARAAEMEFIKLQRQIYIEGLEGEQRQKAEVDDHWLDALQKLDTYKDKYHLTAGQIKQLETDLGNTRSAQMKHLQDAEAAKAAADYVQQIKDDSTAISRIQLDLITDPEAKRIAEVERQFEDMYATLRQIDDRARQVGGDSMVTPEMFAAVDAAKRKAIANVRGPKTPVDYAQQPFGDLVNQRDALKNSLLNETDVEQFRKTTQQIAEISQALSLQLHANAASMREAFQFGFKETAESWGSIAERMKAIGSTLASSMEQNFTDAFTGMILGTKSVEEAFTQMAQSIIADLVRVMVQQLIVRSIIQAIGGIGGFGGAASGARGASAGFDGAGGGIYHRGGVIGVGGDRGRFSPMLFQHAPRFHSGGLIGDEEPVVARRGEVIFTPEQMKMLSGGDKRRRRDVQIVNLTDKREVERMIAANPDLIVNAIGSSPAARSSLRRMLS